MRAYSEELFGPVAAVYRVASDDEAVELANVTSFGLGGTVPCSDLQRARSVSDRIDSGIIWINQPTSTQADLPFGGVKRSGFGRELSRLGGRGGNLDCLDLGVRPVVAGSVHEPCGLEHQQSQLL